MTVAAAPMASLLLSAVPPDPHDVVVPVPLSGLRKRTRGYNQAELLAKGVASGLGLPLQRDAVARTRHTAPQARSTDAEARRRNVEGAFMCRPQVVAGRRVLLLDDVTTTGATLAACAAALKEQGAASVLALAFARED
jgi:ComF family protein